MKVLYTDPPWALDEAGQEIDGWCDLERSVLGPNVQIELGPHRGRKYLCEGPEFETRVKGVDALVIYRCKITSELLDLLAPTCKVVARQGVGIDNLKPDLVGSRGIIAFNVPDYCVDEVSTHAVALALALERGIAPQDRTLRAGRWDIYAGGAPERTCERVAGIIGLGRIGKATARKLNALYHEIRGWDPYVAADLMAGYGVSATASLADLLSVADTVFIHCDLNESSRNLIRAETVRMMKAGSYLINTARGAIVDPDAVLDALQSGTLAGYAADVFLPEDPTQSDTGRKLVCRDDVLMTCHRGFLSRQAELSVRTRVATSVLAALQGETSA
jgi:phosphoglycerate dehydrogenase-like enzyme